MKQRTYQICPPGEEGEYAEHQFTPQRDVDALGERGLEHLRLTCRPEGVLVDGLIIRAKDGAAFRARYQIRCDSRWVAREVRVSSRSQSSKTA